MEKKIQIAMNQDFERSMCNKMRKRMMILGGSALQVPAIRKAKEMGYEVILVDYDENAVGFPLADVKLVVSTLDQEEVYRQALIYKPDVVITSTSDGPVRTAAYVNEKLGKKPDLAYADSLCATIKSDMRDRLKEERVPIPEYYTVRDFSEFREAVDKLKGYCIVKPADNAGSRGVVLLEEKQHTQDKLQEVYEYSKSNSRNGIVMVEEFMTGAEVSVEAMTVNGETTIITITDKQTTQPPFFVEIGHSEPSVLSTEVQEEIRQVALQAIRAIRIQNGPSHTEVKVTERGPKIVEIAARLGGDFITSRLVPLSTGVDMVGNSVLLAAGEEIDLKAKYNKGSAIRFLQGVEGTISHIDMNQKVYKMDGVEEVVLYKKEGDLVSGTKSSNDRVGHVIASGRNVNEAIETAEEALKLIQITID